MFGEVDVFYLNSTLLHADNTSVIQIYVNLVFHEQSKHIKVDFHSICKAFYQHVITLPIFPLSFIWLTCLLRLYLVIDINS